MHPKSLFVGILVALATAEVTQGFGLEVLYHKTVNFTCDLDPTPTGATGVQTQNVYRLWILPNGELLEPDTTGHARVEVLSNGSLLHVKDVNDEDFGLYYCLVQLDPPSQQFQLRRYGLNLNGAYFGDLMALKYRAMIITGLISGAVCFVTVGLICFMYNRHQARLDKQAEEEKAENMANLTRQEMGEKPAVTQKPKTEYTNVAYVPDGEEEKAKPPTQKVMTQQAPPPPPASAAQQQELGNLASAEGATIAKTKL